MCEAQKMEVTINTDKLEELVTRLEAAVEDRSETRNVGRASSSDKPENGHDYQLSVSDGKLSGGKLE